MGRHLVYLGHLIAYVHFKISLKISPETESLHLPHGFVFNKLGSRWRHGGANPYYAVMPSLIENLFNMQIRFISIPAFYERNNTS